MNDQFSMIAPCNCEVEIVMSFGNVDSIKVVDHCSEHGLVWNYVVEVGNPKNSGLYLCSATLGKGEPETEILLYSQYRDKWTDGEYLWDVYAWTSVPQHAPRK